MIKNKKGQYYLIAAMVIITILSVLISTSNFSQITSHENINKEGESLQIESEKLMDYVLFNKDDKKIKEFRKDYSNYLGENYKTFYVIENKKNINLHNFENEKITSESLKTTDKKINVQIPLEENKLTNYSFNLKSGNDLYFIIIKEKGEEKYTYSNEI